MSCRAYEPLYLRQHHQHQPLPEYGGGGGLKDGSINALFVSGLPDDVKPREIHNLFRRRPGFDSCQLKYTGVADQGMTITRMPRRRILWIKTSGEEAANTDDVAENEKVKKTEEDGAAPSSTLFIASLGPNCWEEEMEQALSQYPGFNASKIRARGGMPVAFADFEEVEQATAAKDGLQGTTLPLSDRGGLVIEYTRSKMRKPN